MTKGSIELSAAMSHWTARARAPDSFGRSVSLRSPMCSTMAPDSKSTKPSSSRIGTWPKGCSARILRLVLIALLEQARLVRQAGFLQRPARAQIAYLTLGELGNPFER
jgi:hypothetical protein